MLLVDKALARAEREGLPVRVMVVGAGYMGRAIARQVENTLGLRLIAVVSRRQGHDLSALSQADVVVDATGDVEYGAQVAVAAIKQGKHLVLMNAELDATVGPILKVKADKAGVIITASDGDQPGVLGNLYRYVLGLGMRPVLCGNIKGFHNLYRNPDTQAEFAQKLGQNASMLTSFTDGTKISIEQAIVANGTGMHIAKRGMHGPVVPAGTPIQEAATWYPREELMRAGGIVDYVVGAAPAPGVFIIATEGTIEQKSHLSYYKMGAGPFYVFHVPYHLCHLEVPNSIARAALFNDATLAPIGAPMVGVIATAKKDSPAGTKLDGIGGFTLYGQCENANVIHIQRLLPIGLAKDCILVRDVFQDQVLTYEDVIFPSGRLSDRLYEEQNAFWKN